MRTGEHMNFQQAGDGSKCTGCGNVFVVGDFFCGKCGKKRPQDSLMIQRRQPPRENSHDSWYLGPDEADRPSAFKGSMEVIRPSGSRNSEVSSATHDAAKVIGARSQLDPVLDRPFPCAPLAVERRELSSDSRDRFGMATPETGPSQLSLRGAGRCPAVEPTWESPNSRSGENNCGRAENVGADPFARPIIGRRAEELEIPRQPSAGPVVPVFADMVPPVLPVPVSAAVAEVIGSVNASQKVVQMQNAPPIGYAEMSTQNFVTAQGDVLLETGQTLQDGYDEEEEEAVSAVSWAKLLRPDVSCADDERDDSDAHFVDAHGGRHKARNKRRWSCIPTLTNFPCCVIHCPFLFAVIVLLSVPVLWGVLWPGMEINTGFDLEADTHANEVRAAFLAALRWRGENTARRLAIGGEDHSADLINGISVWERPRGLQQVVLQESPSVKRETIHKIAALTFIYRAKEGNNAISPANLREIRNFELGLRNGKWWKRLCFELGNVVLSSSCDPGLSVVNYVFPEPVITDQNKSHMRYDSDKLKYKLNGRGSEPLPTGTSIVLVKAAQLGDISFPRDHVVDGMDAPLVRSFFEFNLICCNSFDSTAYQKTQSDALQTEWDSFITGELYPAIIAFKDKTHGVDIFYEGGGVISHEIWVTLMSDASMAIGSLSFILIFLTVHTRSICLSLGAIVLAIISIPTAFVTFASLSGSNEFTGAFCLSLFLIVGLGADVVLVFINFWEMSKEHYDKADRPRRLRYLYNNAGVSCLATTITTAASFFANLASVLRPLREFGFFMGLCISLAYVLLLAGYPAVLVLDEYLRDSLSCCFGRSGKGKKGDYFLPKSSPKSPLQLSLEVQICTCRSCGAALLPDAEKCHLCGAAYFEEREEKADKPEGIGKYRLAEFTCYCSYRCCLSCYILRCLVPNRCKVFFFSLVMIIGAIYWTLLEVKVNSAMPEIFPPGHNLNDGKEMASEFKPTNSTWPTVEVNFCTVGPKMSDDKCVLNWCQTVIGEDIDTVLGWKDLNGSAACMCKLVEQQEEWCDEDLGESFTLETKSRFVGVEYVPDSFWESQAWIDHIKSILLKVNRQDDPRLQQLQNASVKIKNAWMNLSALIQEHWEKGTATLKPFINGPDMQIHITSMPRNKSAPTSKGRKGQTVLKKLCSASEVCYCGAPACRLTGETMVQSRSEMEFMVDLFVPAGPMPTSALGSSSRRMAVEQAQEHMNSMGMRPCRYVENGACLSADGAYARRIQVSSSVDSWRLPQLSSQQQPQVNARRLGQLTDVDVVWGLKIKAGTQLLGKAQDTWGFDQDFRVDTPSAQRHMVETCQRARRREELKVSVSMCWIEDFKNSLLSQLELFPVRSSRFPELLQRWAEYAILPHGASVKEQMFMDEFGQLTAAFVRFDVAVSYDRTPANKVLAYQIDWNKFLEAVNFNAPPGLSGGWHTSRLWIRAEAEQAIVGSTLYTLSVSVGCGFFGALFFTGDFPLSIMVVLCVIGVTAMLAFFMTIVMGWGYGVIEVLGLIVFVGYSITYSLHIAHKYREHTRLEARPAVKGFRKTRESATVFSLTVMTTAVLGSAVTTLGAAFFMFFCTMRIFVKLAAILFAVTFFAAVFAVVVLPSALLCVGPLGFCGLGSIAWCFGCKQTEPEATTSMQRLLSSSSVCSEEGVAAPACPSLAKSPSGKRLGFDGAGERARTNSEDGTHAVELVSTSTQPVPPAGAGADRRIGPVDSQVEATLTPSPIHPPGPSNGFLPSAGSAVVQPPNARGMALPPPARSERQAQEPLRSCLKARPRVRV